MCVEHEKGFGVILESTAELIAEAENISPYSATASAAVLQSALLVEAAANCCMFHLNLNNKLAGELDRLPSLTKLDLFLLLKTQGTKTLDRGAAFYQDVQELKKLRDMSVHPKSTKITWVKTAEDSAAGEYEKSGRLGISLAHFAWSVEDAIKSFMAVNQFLNDYFNNLCEMEPVEIRLLLLAPVGDGEVEDMFLSTRELEELQNKHGIPLTYVGVGVD